MDPIKEYHDPDYPEAAVCVKEEPPSTSEEEKVEKIKCIIRREFANELEARESEVMLIDQRMSMSRRLLHKLRYSLVTRYYWDQKLHLNNGQIQDEIAAQRDPRARAEVGSILQGGQRQLHPSVRKLLGKQAVDLDEIFRSRGPRNKTRKDYSAMLQKRNYTISADATKSLRPGAEPPAAPPPPEVRKVPRRLEPRIQNVVTVDEATRNQVKHRYRIVIGNTSKYVPPASRLDRSTHKWLLYVRSARGDVSAVVSAVTVTLHHSYAPHHRVHLDKPPYHISRRGWGEFPAKVELHFAAPARNRPAALEHRIKLDRNYTGQQVLGSETVVDVWLYSTPEMLPYEFKEENTPPQIETNVSEQIDTIPEFVEIKQEPNTEKTDDNWMDFFTKAPTELDVDEMIIKPDKQIKIESEEIATEVPTYNEEFDITSENIKKENEDAESIQVPDEILNQPASVKKRIVKYIDPTTGKIYYLEMDRELDLSKVQEIIINNTTAKISPIKSNGLKNARKKKGVSLLKPEIKSLLRSENREKLKPNLAHIENDHCYLATPKASIKTQTVQSVEVKKEKSLFSCLCAVMPRLSNVRAAVNYLVKKIPLISEEARDPDFLKHFPFVVESNEKYWKLDFAKRRNIEWSRAKLINRLLSDHFPAGAVWRTKQILLYVRLHGYHPIRHDAPPTQCEESEWSSWGELQPVRQLDSDIREAYPDATNINSLSIFNFKLDSSANDTLELSDDEEIDIVGTGTKPEVKTEAPDVTGLEVLPVERDEDRLRYLFVERACLDIGIELRNEDVGSGYSYSAVHAVLVSALRSFAEEMVRSALAGKRRRAAPRAAASVWGSSCSSRGDVSLADAAAGARAARVRVLTACDLAATRKTTHTI